MKKPTCKLSALVLALGMTTATIALAEVSTPTDLTTTADIVTSADTTTDVSVDVPAQNLDQTQLRMGPPADRPELLSEEERADFRDRMKSAETMEERQAIHEEIQATIKERAEAAGIELPEQGEREMMRGDRPELLSEEERMEFRERMQSAETIEERQTIREEIRATVQERAEAAGIELPEQGRGDMMRGQRPERAGMEMRGERPDRAEMVQRLERGGMGMRGGRPERPMTTGSGTLN